MPHPWFEDYKLMWTKIQRSSAFWTALLALAVTSCAKHEDKSPAPAVSDAHAPATSTLTIDDRLAALENADSCNANGVQEMNAVHAEVREQHLHALNDADELSAGLNLATKTDAYYARLRALAARCVQNAAAADKAKYNDLANASAAEAVAQNFLADKAALCRPESAEILALAPRALPGLSAATHDKLAAAFRACGTADAQTLVQKSALAKLHAQVKRAAADACSLDSQAFADEQSPEVAKLYKNSLPTIAAQLLSRQLALGLAGELQKLTCEPEKRHEPALNITALDAEFRALLANDNRCRVENAFDSLRSRAVRAEAADQAALLSGQYRQKVTALYVNFRARIQTAAFSCNEQREANFKRAHFAQALELWRRFAEAPVCSDERAAEYARVMAAVRQFESADQSLDLTAEGRDQLNKMYADLGAQMKTWADKCRDAMEQEKRRLEEEKRKEEQQRKAEEERQREEQRKQAEEQKRKEEEQRKLEEQRRQQEEQQRKRAEEQKRKEEEQRRRDAEQRRKDEERRRIEEQKRQQEEQRKQAEEQKRKEELERQQEFQRKQEERKRLEKQKREEWNLRRLRLTAPRWGESSVRKPWTEAVLKVVQSRIEDFNKARDVEDFCPGYRTAEPYEQENCWLLLVTAISEHESNFKTSDSFTEGNGVDSIGLLALSPGECRQAHSARELGDPVRNLLCGVEKMADLVARDKVIDGSRDAKGNDLGGRSRGIAAYWSTVRPRYKQFDRRRNRYLTLGHKADILGITRRFRALRAGVAATPQPQEQAKSQPAKPQPKPAKPAKPVKPSPGKPKPGRR